MSNKQQQQAPTIVDATAVFADISDTIDDLDDGSEAIVGEAVAIQEFVGAIGEMVANGLDEADARSLCGNLASITGHTKTDLVEKVEQEADRMRSESSDAPRPFNEVVDDDLVHVIIQTTTDSHHKRTFRWLFASDDYQCVIETRTSKDDKHSHYDWTNFRDDYFDARNGAEMPGQPPKYLRQGDNWRQFLSGIISERREVEKVKGSRTIAVEQLQRQIRQSKAYRRLSDALQRDGVGVDDWPEADVEELWIPNARIKRICDENEITTRALQSELSSQGLDSREINGVSDTAEETTWWRLRRDLAEPSDFVEEPETAAGRMAAVKGQTAATDGGSTTGLIGSVSPADAEENGGNDDE
jgi:hypothetical protein